MRKTATVVLALAIVAMFATTAQARWTSSSRSWSPATS